MSLTEPETQALGSIADGLAGSDPRLASMLNIFSRLAAGEEMPAREKTRSGAAVSRVRMTANLSPIECSRCTPIGGAQGIGTGRAADRGPHRNGAGAHDQFVVAEQFFRPVGGGDQQLAGGHVDPAAQQGCKFHSCGIREPGKGSIKPSVPPGGCQQRPAGPSSARLRSDPARPGDLLRVERTVRRSGLPP